MSARSVVVFGDSVTWGQGLLDTHKLGTLVASGLSPAGELVVDMRAHSGAVVGAPDLVELAAVDGEVPVGLPSIFEQVESFQPSHPPALVIVNGGINDVDIRRLLNPFMDIGHLRALTRRYCGDRMRLLLNLLRARIEDVPIVVVGYFPVLSTESHPFRMPFLLEVNGVGLPLFVPHELVFAKIVTQCEVFWEESDRRAAAGGRHLECRCRRPAGHLRHAGIHAPKRDVRAGAVAVGAQRRLHASGRGHRHTSGVVRRGHPGVRRLRA